MKRDLVTLVLVSEKRVPLTLEFSIRELVLIVVLLLALVAAAGYSIFNFKNLRQQHAQLISTVDALEVELAGREHKITQLRVELEKRQGLVVLVSPGNDSLQVAEDILSDKIRIDNLHSTLNGNELNLSLDLTKMIDDGSITSGFLIAVAEHYSAESGMNAVFPAAAKAGQPVDFRRGDWYSIRNFKIVQARIELQDKPENYPRLKILVFDANGQLLIHQTTALEQ